MSDSPQVPAVPEREFDLFDLVRASLSNWLVIGFCIVLGVAAISAWMYRHPPETIAHVMVKKLAPEDDPTPGTNSGSITNRILGGGTDESVALYLSTMLSIELVEKAIRERGLAQLVQPWRWNAETGTWVEDTGFIADVKRTLRRIFNRPTSVDPESPAVVLEALRQMIMFDTFDSKAVKDTWVVSVRTEDPKRSLAIITALHEEAINLIRTKKRERTASLLKGMRDRYEQVTERSYRDAFLGQMITLEKRLLLLKDESFPVIDVIDPPSIASPPISLPLMVGLILGIVGGGVLGLMINVGWFAYRLSKRGGCSASTPTLPSARPSGQTEPSIG